MRRSPAALCGKGWQETPKAAAGTRPAGCRSLAKPRGASYIPVDGRNVPCNLNRDQGGRIGLQ